MFYKSCLAQKKSPLFFKNCVIKNFTKFRGKNLSQIFAFDKDTG